MMLRICAFTVATLTLAAPFSSYADDAAPAANVATQADDVPRPSYKLAIGLGAGAVASLVTGITLGAFAKQRENEQNGSTSNPPVYTPKLNSRGKQGETFADIGYAFIGIGCVLAISDIVLWVERLRPHKKAPTASLLSPVPGVLITPAALQVSF
ncbi:MAG: hypothetical protein ABI321_20615 [Polyangia bacterium]